MRVLTVHVGYDVAEIESPEFQNYMKRSKAEIENLYGKKNIDVGFHIPDKETPSIGSYGFEHIILSDPEEIAVLKRRLQKQVGAIDIVDVRINPKAAGRDYFGLGGQYCTTPGPVKNGGEYELPYKGIVEHEIMHCISGNTMKHNPTYFGDGYFRNLYDGEARSILGGHHQEFIPADKDGKPIEGGSKTMKKVLSLATPEDHNVFMVDRNGNKHKLLLVNPSPDNIMRTAANNAKRVQSMKNGTYVSPSQKAAIKEVIKDYLIGEKRLEATKAVQRPKMVVKNKTSKKAPINLAQKLGKGQRG